MNFPPSVTAPLSQDAFELLDAADVDASYEDSSRGYLGTVTFPSPDVALYAAYLLADDGRFYPDAATVAKRAAASITSWKKVS